MVVINNNLGKDTLGIKVLVIWSW